MMIDLAPGQLNPPKRKRNQKNQRKVKNIFWSGLDRSQSHPSESHANKDQPQDHAIDGSSRKSRNLAPVPNLPKNRQNRRKRENLG